MSGHTTVTAHHAYDPERDDELKLEKGDIVIVTDSSDPDWWVGKKDDGSSGFFPSNFVEPVKSLPEEKKEDDKKEEQQPESTTTAEPTTETEAEAEPAKPIGMARVMEDYAMQGPYELTLHRGGIATLYERFEDGWFKGEINGKVGRFPGECVEEIDMPGRPDLGAQSVGMPNTTPESTEEGTTSPTEPSKPAFKLAAFGVRQGGIGSVLAGGFPTLKKTGGPRRPSETEPKPASPPVVEKPTEATPPPKDEPPIKEEETPVAKTEPERKTSIPVDKFDQDEQPSSAPTIEKFVAKAIVLHPYDAENEDELNLLRGEYVNVLDKNVDDGWWKGTTERGQTGVFPSNFVKEIEEESIASPPPVRSRKSVTSSGSQQSFNTASSSRVSSEVSARAPPLPGNRPSSTASTSRPGSLHEQQQSTPTLDSPTPSQPPAIPEEELSPAAAAAAAAAAPVVTESPAPIEAEEEKFSPVQEVEEPKKVEEEQVIEKEDEPSPPSVASPPVPSRPPKPASRPTSEVSSPADKPPLPSSRTTSEALSEKQPPLPASRPTSEASSSEKLPPKPASRPSSQVESEKADSPVVTAAEVDSKKEEEDKAATSPAVVDQEKEEEVVEKEEKEEEKPSEETTGGETEQKEEAKNPEEEGEEKKTLDLQPTGPKLSGPSRARPTRARRAPQSQTAETRKEEPSQMELLKKELEKEPEEPVKKDEPADEPPTAAARSPPAKPAKPIFAKFPTPFGGAAPELKNLKPVQRRMWEPAPAHESKEPEKKEESGDDQVERPRPTGVRNIASRFNVPTTGGGSNEVLETKLKNFTKNEVDKLRKELNEEREKRIQLEQLVASLAEQVDKLQQQ